MLKYYIFLELKLYNLLHLFFRGIIRVNGSSDIITDLKVFGQDHPSPVSLPTVHNAYKVEIQYFANISGIQTICLTAKDL